MHKRKRAEEDAHVARFWALCDAGATRQEKLALLQELSRVKVFTGFKDSSSERTRKRFQVLTSKGHRQKDKRCSLCPTQTATKLQRHHIVALKNGGTNRPHNIVTLCDRCHQVIHPWL